VQTDGGAMFVPGMVNITEAPFNDMWTIRGEEKFLPQWKEEDAKLFSSINPMEYFHRLQIQDFLQAIVEKRTPAVTGEDGRKTVELFTAIYRATRDKKAVKFPLTPE
jgi:UDP-N-acetyl-2-amino-2-deoxyglucuronate dehydrogenase